MTADGSLLIPGVIVSGAFSVGAFLIKLWLGRLQTDMQGLTGEVRKALDGQALHNTRLAMLEGKVEGIQVAHAESVRDSRERHEKVTERLHELTNLANIRSRRK